MSEHNQVATRLLECFLRSYSIPELTRHLDHNVRLRESCGWLQVKPLLEALEVASWTECAAFLSDLHEAHRPVAPVALMIVLHRFGHFVHPDEVRRLVSLVPELHAPLPEVLSTFHQAHRSIVQGQAANAIDLLTHELDHLGSVQEDSPTELAYSSCLLHRKLGEAFLRAGNFLLAHEHLKTAQSFARARGLSVYLYCTQQLASLHWASGQIRKALSMHLDPGLRERAAQIGNHRFLVQSHLSAAKCAVDLRSLDQARIELGKAHEVLAAHLPGLGRYPGYALLYEGEILAHEGHLERAFEVLRDAETNFARLDPAFVPGVLEAQIAMVHVALLENDAHTALALVKKLLEVAERQGCLEARSRLLVLEVSLRLRKDPILQAAYDELISRAHLINNPALLLRVLADLFIHAIENQELPQQTYLYERIVNLRQVLEKSCFEDLFREYVRERCASAVENRVRRHIEQSGLSLDELDTPPDEPLPGGHR